VNPSFIPPRCRRFQSFPNILLGDLCVAGGCLHVRVAQLFLHQLEISGPAQQLRAAREMTWEDRRGEAGRSPSRQLDVPGG